MAARSTAATAMNVPVGAALWSAFLFRIGQSAVGVIVSLALARVAAGDRGTSAAVVGILLSTNFAVELVAAPTFGGLSDRFGRKPLMVAGPLLGFLASQIYPATSALAPLFLARGLDGAGAGSLTPSSLGFLSDATTTTLERRGRTMAYFEIATLLGIGGGYALGGVLYQGLGPHAFRVANAAYLLSMLAALRLPATAAAPPLGVRPSLARYLTAAAQPAIVRLAPAWLAATGVLGVWFANTVYQLSGPSRPGQALMGGFSGNTVSAILAAFVVALIAGTYLWGRLFSRFRRKTTMTLIALGGMFVVCLDLLAVNHRDGASAVWLAPLLIVLAVAAGAESGFTPAALAFLADVTEDVFAERGAIMGLYSLFLGVGEVVGGVVGGWFAQAWGLDGLIFVTLILAAIALFGVLATRAVEPASPVA